MNYKILHIVRAVTPTSMPWNDLYKTHRSIEKNQSGLVASIGIEKSPGIYFDEEKVPYLKLNLITAILPLHRLIKKNKIRGNDVIIHIHNMSLIPYAILFKSKNIKIVLNVHNSLINFNSFQKLFLNLFIRYFDSVITVSHAVSEEVKFRYPSEIDKITAIPNGIHVPILERIHDSNINQEKEIDVIIIARIVEQKNIEGIIKALASVKNLKKVAWYGDGIELEKLKKLLDQHSLKKIVSLKGIRPRTEVLEAISRSKLYLSLSKWEGIGVANIEALSLPTEVLLSDIPPHKELYVDGNLWMVSLDDTNEYISRKISNILKNEDKRKDYLLRRAQETKKKFDLRILIQEYIEIYRNL